MPKVEQFGPSKVQRQVVTGARAQSVAPGSFGAPIAQGLDDLTQGLTAMQGRMDATAAEEALLQFERDKNDLFFNPETGYFNSQGRDAFDNAEAASTSMEKLKAQYLDGLQSDAAKQAFGRAADVHITRGRVDIGRHSAKGLQAWEVATINAQTENSIENAALYWNDSERMGIQRELGRQSVIEGAKIQGITGEALNEQLQNFESSFAGTAIAAATAQSAAQGQAVMDEMGSRLEGPDFVKAEKAIAAKTKTEKTQRDAQLSVVQATNIVDQHDDIGAMYDEVNKIQDPELRKKTRTEVTAQYNTRIRVEKQRQSDAYDAAIDHVNTGGSALEFQAQNPEAWERMSATQRNNMLNGKHLVTDQVVFNELLTMPATELAKVDPNDYVGQFTKGDMSKLRTSVDKAKRGQTITSVQSLSAKTNAMAEQFFGKKSSWGKDKRESVNGLMTAIQNAVQDAEELKGGKLTPRETDELLADFSRKIVVERSAFGFDMLASDLSVDLSNAPASEVAAVNRVVDQVGQENTAAVVEVRQYLLDNNIPVTEQTLSQAYQQATR